MDEEVVEQKKLDQNPFVQQVMSDVANIANEDISDSDERFSILSVESGGYVLWDNLKDNLYVNEDGYEEQQVTLEDDQKYLEQVKKTVAAKEAVEWEYIEHAKFEASLEPSYQVGDTVYLEGDPYTITEVNQSSVQLLPPDMLYPIY